MNSVSKYFIAFVFTCGSCCVVSQTDFFKLYGQVDELNKRIDQLVPMRKDLTVADSVEITALQKKREKLHKDSILLVLRPVTNLSFPDISFTDVHNKDHSVSDFKGSDLIINYNYLYCMSCVHRIDSTLKRTGPKHVKVLVLVSDLYKKDLADLEQYGDKIIVGLINYDNGELLSLKQGDDCFYYLSASQQIEFFDRSKNDHRNAWLAFLDEHLK